MRRLPNAELHTVPYPTGHPVERRTEYVIEGISYGKGSGGRGGNAYTNAEVGIAPIVDAAPRMVGARSSFG